MAKSKHTAKHAAASPPVGVYRRAGDVRQPIFTPKALQFLRQLIVNVWESDRLGALAASPEIQTNHEAALVSWRVIENIAHSGLLDEATAPMRTRAREITTAQELLRMAVEEHSEVAVLTDLAEAVPLNLSRTAPTN
jgi:hypothetical protein